jgi:hypothetical protein
VWSQGDQSEGESSGDQETETGVVQEVSAGSMRHSVGEIRPAQRRSDEQPTVEIFIV